MSLHVVVLFVLGGAFLVAGAELLVRGASRLAIAAGVSPLVVGLTIVAFGTSSPEMAVTAGAAWTGQADVALGNVVGSNIFNVLFILGISALIAPLVVSQQLVRLDVPIMIGTSLLMAAFALDGRVSRIEGLVLFAGIIAYTSFLVRLSRRESAGVKREYEEAFGSDAPRSGGSLPVNLTMIVGGLALLVLGSRWFVQAAVATAEALGLSQLVIGLTIVAAGTSLPEVATSVLASIRGERDIAVGNVVGSNIFNILAVLGAGAVIAPNGIAVAPGALAFDIPVMIAVAVACLPIFFTGYMIARWEGLLFLAFYVAYTAFLIMKATAHHLLPAFSTAMLWFVLPMTGVTLAVLGFRAWRKRRQ